MIIYLGADHRGFNLKENIKKWLKNKGYEIYDVGAQNLNENDDYVDFAQKLAEEMQKKLDNALGILICGSGVGMCVVANKFKNIYAGIGVSPDQVFKAKSHDNINVLSIASDFVDENLAKKMIDVFLLTPFDRQENHYRRIQKIQSLEEKLCK